MAVGTGSSPHAWRPDSLHPEALGCGPCLFSSVGAGLVGKEHPVLPQTF